MEEKIIATRHIFDGKIVKLAVHDVTLPDGQTSKREVINHMGAAAVIAVDDNQQVLLVKQYRLPAGKILYEIPAGTLEPDEAPEVCAERELREETGYRPTTLQTFGGLYTAPGYTTEYIHLFLATGYEPDPLGQDDDEFVEAVRMPLVDAIAMIAQGQIEDAKSVIGLLKAARHYGL